MKKKILLTVILAVMLVAAIMLASGCESGVNGRKNARVYLPDELPEGVLSIEVIPYNSATDKDGNVEIFVERNENYVIRLVFAEGYEPGDMKLNVCGTPRDIDLYRIEKNVIYQVNDLVAPGAIDIDVEFVGTPVKVSSDVKLGYESSLQALPESAYSRYEVEFDAGLFGIARRTSTRSAENSVRYIPLPQSNGASG